VKHLSSLPKTRITRISLSFLVFEFHFLAGGRNKPWSILPWSECSFLSKHFKRALNVSINVISKPNKNLGIKVDKCIPDGLHSKTQVLSYLVENPIVRIFAV
jgi:hypothetical protein